MAKKNVEDILKKKYQESLKNLNNKVALQKGSLNNASFPGGTISISQGSGGMANPYYWSPYKVNFFDDTQEFCRACGEELKGPATYYSPAPRSHLCNECLEKVWRHLGQAVMPEDRSSHCATCGWHIKACTCDTKAAVDKLKQ